LDSLSSMSSPRAGVLQCPGGGSSEASLGTAKLRLPVRPIDDWPEDHCVLPGCRFSFLPAKYRAPVALPPMKVVKAVSEPKLGLGRRKRKSAKRQELPVPEGVPGCYGDFCRAEFRFPNSLKDIQLLDDAWTRQGRELCNKKVSLFSDVTLGPVLEPEELVACLEHDPEPGDKPRGERGEEPKARSRRAVADPLPGQVCFSVIMEARSHPTLCGWLEALSWRLDPKDAVTVTNAAAKLQTDEQQGGGYVSKRMDRSLAGFRYRLKVVPVCRTCASVYKIVHDVISMIRVQRKDLWAARELRRRRQEEEEERERIKQAEIERMLTYQRQRASRSSPRPKAASVMLRQSLFLEPDVQELLRLIPDSPSAGTPLAFRPVAEPLGEELETETQKLRRSIRQRRKALFESLGGLEEKDA